MRSGIGDGEALRRLSIAPIHHAPGVGRNLQDHMGLSVQIESRDRRCYGLSLRAMPRNAWACVEYALFRRGMLATNVVEAGGFYRTDPALDRPNIQYSFMAARMTSAGRLVGAGNGFGVATILLRPASRGHVALAAPDARVAPIIDFNAFAADEDMKVFLAGYRHARSILSAPAFAPYRIREASPGDQVQTDADLEAHIRANVGTIFHPTGTCRMGIDSDAVVDPELRVRGLDGLRVVDASIMPTIIGGNTNAPTIMIAEKAADMICGRAPLPPAADA
jgi:choline dehydrogenase-like flavoprotein